MAAIAQADVEIGTMSDHVPQLPLSNFRTCAGYPWVFGGEKSSEQAALKFWEGTMTHCSPSRGLPVGIL